MFEVLSYLLVLDLSGWYCSSRRDNKKAPNIVSLIFVNEIPLHRGSNSWNHQGWVVAVWMNFVFVYIGCVIHGEPFIKWIWPLSCLQNTHRQVMPLFCFLETLLLFSSVDFKNFQILCPSRLAQWNALVRHSILLSEHRTKLSKHHCKCSPSINLKLVFQRCCKECFNTCCVSIFLGITPVGLTSSVGKRAERA